MKRPAKKPVEPEVATPGALANCERCGRLLRVAETRREDSAPFRLSKTKKGVCPDCVMTQFLYETYPVNMLIDEAGPEMLLNAGVMRMAFSSAGILDRCELQIEEIDWERVVANWSLPVKVTRDGRNPYRMGEGPRARSRGDDGVPAGKLPPLGFFGPRRSRFDGSLVVSRGANGELLANGRPLSEDEPELGAALKGLFDELDKRGPIQ
jgi:hypothetical protein